MSVEDRQAIQDLIARYAVAVDTRHFDALDELFTADAHVDYRALGGPAGSLTDIKVFLRDSMSLFRRSQHLMGLPVIDLDGDRATARTPCTNPMVVDDTGGGTKVWLIGLWYDDDLVRTGGGWRFAQRRQERGYSVVGLLDTALGPA